MSVPANRGYILPSWLTRSRIIGYSCLVAVGYLVLAVTLHLMAARQVADGRAPMVTDFNTFYAVPLLLRDHDAASAYQPPLLHEAELAAVRQAYPRVTDQQLTRVPVFTWLYPPTTMLLVAPLGLLPYWVAYAAWIATTLLLWLAAVRLILPGPATAWVALALPATFLNGMFGQMGFLTAGLLGLGLGWLVERPLLAGIAIGLLTLKPHLGLLLPLALLCGGHWRAILAASVTTLVLVAASVVAFGWAPWTAFFAQADLGGNLMESGAVPWSLMPTTFPALRLLGLPSGPAYGVQAVVSAAAAGAVIWAWRRPASHALKAAVLTTATLLALPFAHAYDLVLMTLPLFWLTADGLRTRREVLLLALMAALPFLVPGLGGLGVPVGPPLMALFLVLLLRREADDSAQRQGVVRQ